MRLVYCSPVRWGSFTQRPHEFVRWFNNTSGGEVLWIDPYPTRLPTFADLKISRNIDVIDQVGSPEWIKIYRPQAFPIEPLPGGNFINRLFFWRKLKREVLRFTSESDCCMCIGRPSEGALKLLQKFDFSVTCYDAMDDFPAFYEGLSSRSVLSTENTIIKLVDRIIAASTNLKIRLAAKKRNVSLVRNACAADLLPAMRIPANYDLPVIGYVGTVGNWFDWDFVIALAKSMIGVRIEIIGPVFKKPGQQLPKNISIVPSLRHTEALNRMRSFSVGMIPFKITKLTSSVDPIKYYEYRAIGLPIVSTAFGEMKFREKENGVFLVNHYSQLNTVLKKALQYKPDDREIMKFRQKNNWKARFDDIGLFAV